MSLHMNGFCIVASAKVCDRSRVKVAFTDLVLIKKRFAKI